MFAHACQTTPNVTQDDREKQVRETQLALIHDALDSGQPQRALHTLRDLLRLDPNDPVLNNLMGLTQLALKNGTRAVYHLQIAFKAKRDTATGLNLSSALLETGDYEKAAKLLQALLKQAKRERYAYKERILHNLGYAMIRLKQTTKGESWLRAALDENPTFFPAHMELGRLYEQTHRKAKAAQSYRRAMDYCHVCFEPVEALSTIHMQAGRYREARQVLSRFVKIEGIAAADRARADQLLRLATTSGLDGRQGPRRAAR